MEKVVYGVDSRIESADASTKIITWARSTVAQIPRSNLIEQDGGFKLEADTLEDGGICAEDRFAKQISAARCSGFLVGGNLIITAGHCVKGQYDCDENAWVFDYIDGKTNFTKKEVFNCKRVIKTELSYNDKNDFAIIELDRSPKRKSLSIRYFGKVEDKANLAVIGHPSGLPQKIAFGQVRSNANDIYFVTNLDTFGGNSGSAVIDTKTGTVEGILVRGETDYVYNYSKGCDEVKYCDEDGCRGEDVTRITNLAWNVFWRK